MLGYENDDMLIEPTDYCVFKLSLQCINHPSYIDLNQVIVLQLNLLSRLYICCELREHQGLVTLNDVFVYNWIKNLADYVFYPPLQLLKGGIYRCCFPHPDKMQCVKNMRSLYQLKNMEINETRVSYSHFELLNVSTYSTHLQI